MCFLAILGIVLMIIANELTFNRIDDGDTQGSWAMKFLITISTLILLTLLVYYHYLVLKLYSNQNSLSDHRVGLSWKKIFLIALELIICFIHPFPGTFPQIDAPRLDSNANVTTHTLSYTATHVGLSLPSKFIR